MKSPSSAINNTYDSNLIEQMDHSFIWLSVIIVFITLILRKGLVSFDDIITIYRSACILIPDGCPWIEPCTF